MVSDGISVSRRHERFIQYVTGGALGVERRVQYAREGSEKRARKDTCRHRRNLSAKAQSDDIDELCLVAWDTNEAGRCGFLCYTDLAPRGRGRPVCFFSPYQKYVDEIERR